MINCEKYLPLLYDFVKGKLSITEVSEIRQHLDSCSECREALAEEKATIELLSSIPLVEEPTLDIWSKIESRLPENRQGLLNRFWYMPQHKFMRAAAGFVAAAAILAVVVTGVYSPKTTQPTDAPVQKGYVVTAEWTDDPMASSSEAVLQSIDKM